jgi:hypothetical protein
MARLSSEEYAAARGELCPVCGSEFVNSTWAKPGHRYPDGYYRGGSQCMECGSIWTDVLAITVEGLAYIGYEDLSPYDMGLE